jgi:hypothetical protein
MLAPFAIVPERTHRAPLMIGRTDPVSGQSRNRPLRRSPPSGRSGAGTFDQRFLDDQLRAFCRAPAHQLAVEI